MENSHLLTLTSVDETAAFIFLIKNITVEMCFFCSMHRSQRLNHKWFKVYTESTVTNQTHGFTCKYVIV